MINPEEIYKDLQPKLEELDKERIKFYKKVEPFKYLFWIVFTVGGVYVIASLNFEKMSGLPGTDENLPLLVISYVVLAIASLLFYLITHFQNSSQFKEIFVTQIAPKIVRGMGRSFKYEYRGVIPSEEITGSLLFAPYDHYQCQDMVKGELNGMPIQFAELKLTKRQVDSDQEKSSAPAFSGIYFRADLTVTFPTDIWLTSKMHSTILKNHGKYKLKIDHPALKKYSPYATDPALATKVLQPAVLERIGILNLKLKQRKVTNSVVHYHFGKQRLELAIKTRSKFMEPKLGRSIDTMAFIERQTSLLNALSTILKDLTLA